MRTRKEIRAEARDVLGHKLFGDKWLYVVLLVLVYSLLVGACGAFYAIPLIILGGAFEIGFERVILKAKRRETPKADLNHFFDAFKEDFAGSILLYLLVNIFLFLWFLLLIIPGIIKSYSYRMAYKIKSDNPKLEWKECIDKSRELMNGYKWKCFVLDLSFIGWYIVGFLCLFVGTLWVHAYHSTAIAVFYDELLNKNGEKMGIKVDEEVFEHAPVVETTEE